MRRYRFSAVLAAGCLVWAVAAAAQNPSRTSGLAIEAGVHAAAWQFDDTRGDPASGGGLGVALHYGIAPNISLYTRMDLSSLEDGETGTSQGMAHVDIGVLYHFGAETDGWRPFAGALISGWSTILNTRPETEYGGAGPGIAGGVRYNMTPDLAVTSTLFINRIDLNTVNIDGRPADSQHGHLVSSRMAFSLLYRF